MDRILVTNKDAITLPLDTKPLFQFGFAKPLTLIFHFTTSRLKSIEHAIYNVNGLRGLSGGKICRKARFHVILGLNFHQVWSLKKKFAKETTKNFHKKQVEMEI